MSRRLARALRLLQAGLAACALIPLGVAFVAGAFAGWLEERTP